MKHDHLPCNYTHHTLTYWSWLLPMTQYYIMYLTDDILFQAAERRHVNGGLGTRGREAGLRPELEPGMGRPRVGARHV